MENPYAQQKYQDCNNANKINLCFNTLFIEPRATSQEVKRSQNNSHITKSTKVIPNPIYLLLLVDSKGKCELPSPQPSLYIVAHKK